MLLLLAVLLATTYACLLAGELLFLAVQGPQQTRDWRLSMVGAFRAAEPDSYELVPGWSGHWDDGIDRHPVAIDAHGNRDEPRTGEFRRRVLLAGDSFAFGLAIAREHCVDVRMEAHATVPTDAINLGVPGYGPWDVQQRIERAAARGDDLVYLFFTNDLRADQAHRGSYTAVGGVILRRRALDGQPLAYREEDVRAQLAAQEQQRPSPWAPLKSVVRLQRVRARLQRLLVPDTGLVVDPHRFEPRGVDSTVAAVEAMAALARERGARFTVVIAPELGEAEQQRRFAPVARFVERVRAAGHPVVDLLPLLGREHYLPHDGHWNAAGADVCARALIAHLEGR